MHGRSACATIHPTKDHTKDKEHVEDVCHITDLEESLKPATTTHCKISAAADPLHSWWTLLYVCTSQCNGSCLQRRNGNRNEKGLYKYPGKFVDDPGLGIGLQTDRLFL